MARPASTLVVERDLNLQFRLCLYQPANRQRLLKR